tara:strand:+ start:1538 stop:1762 length:225 start_codon:yes stop_codon:yes gene_type:complete
LSEKGFDCLSTDDGDLLIRRMEDLLTAVKSLYRYRTPHEGGTILGLLRDLSRAVDTTVALEVGIFNLEELGDEQ